MRRSWRVRKRRICGGGRRVDGCGLRWDGGRVRVSWVVVVSRSDALGRSMVVGVFYICEEAFLFLALVLVVMVLMWMGIDECRF